MGLARQTWLVMGPSGAGKTTLGQALARRLQSPFLDADDLHPPGNRAKMAAGEPLTDGDRWPWLDAVATRIAGWRAGGLSGVVACSALRRVYRDRLRAADPDLRVVALEADATELARRLAERTGHFFAPSLLASQLALLEPPDATECALRVDAALATADAVERLVAGAGAR